VTVLGRSAAINDRENFPREIADRIPASARSPFTSNALICNSRPEDRDYKRCIETRLWSFTLLLAQTKVFLATELSSAAVEDMEEAFCPNGSVFSAWPPVCCSVHEMFEKGLECRYYLLNLKSFLNA
jgi:hypothetical protein